MTIGFGTQWIGDEKGCVVRRLPQREEYVKPDLEAVLIHYGIQPRGKKFMASCPWHKDTRPSLSVDLNKQLFKCQSCGRGGDSWTFIQEEERTDFRGAQAAGAALGLTQGVADGEREERSGSAYAGTGGRSVARRKGHREGRRTWRPTWGSAD